jgi:hypothetical protein
MIARWQRLALLSMSATAIAAGALPGKSNWDRVRWEMDDAAFFRAYPSADWPRESWKAAVAVTRISRSSFLARNIQRGTQVQFQFGYDDRYKLETVRFVAPGSYDQIAILLERKLGPPVAGDRDESRCFDAKGVRQIEDPSGVGHVIASCLAGATFVDRPRGNVVFLSTVYELELAEYGSRSKLGAAQLVAIEPLGTCEACAQPK